MTFLDSEHENYDDDDDDDDDHDGMMMMTQPCSQGPLSTSRKYHDYGWSRVC